MILVGEKWPRLTSVSRGLLFTPVYWEKLVRYREVWIFFQLLFDRNFVLSKQSKRRRIKFVKNLPGIYYLECMTTHVFYLITTYHQIQIES